METHLEAQKRKLYGLEHRCQTLEDLFDILRSRPEDESIKIIDRIRSGADADSVLAAVHEDDLLHKLHPKPEYRTRYEFPYIRELPPSLDSLQGWHNPYLRSIIYTKTNTTAKDQYLPPKIEDGAEDEYHKIYYVPHHVLDLVDERILSMDITKWTNVSFDVSMLRQLLQVYFKFEFPFHPYFHKDIFLDDMLAESQRFCSPLLVNAVLAAAWHGYSSAQTRAAFWMPCNLGYRFFAEAQRLLELELASTETAITTVQATAIMHLTCFSNGIDDVGWKYLHKSIELARGLGLFTSGFTQSREWQAVAASTAWSLFNWQAFASYHTFHPPLIEDPPTHPLPQFSSYASVYRGELWVKCPMGKEPISTYNSLVFKATSEFRVIMNDIAKQTFQIPGSRSEISLNETLLFRSRLAGWYDNLPDPLTPRNIALPAHLKLHMHYHVILISLLLPFDKMSPIPGGGSPGQIVAQSKACLETLIRLYYLRHGFETYDPTLLQFLPLLTFSTLEDLSLLESGSDAHKASRSTLALCVKGLWDQGQSCYAPEAVFHMVRESVGADEARLIRDIVGTEQGDDRMELMAREVRSSWPVGIFNITDDNEHRTLNQFIRWWEKQGKNKVMELKSQDRDIHMAGVASASGHSRG